MSSIIRNILQKHSKKYFHWSGSLVFVLKKRHPSMHFLSPSWGCWGLLQLLFDEAVVHPKTSPQSIAGPHTYTQDEFTKRPTQWPGGRVSARLEKPQYYETLNLESPVNSYRMFLDCEGHQSTWRNPIHANPNPVGIRTKAFHCEGEFLNQENQYLWKIMQNTETQEHHWRLTICGT